MIVIPGVRKCGTTTLYDWLSDHPGVCPNKNTKEPQWLVLNPELIEAVQRRIQSGYRNKDSVCLDGSTYPFYFPHAIKNVKRFIRHPKILIVIRDPARRAYSAFCHNRRKSKRIEARRFKEVLDSIESIGGGIERAEERSCELAQARGLIRPGNGNYTNLAEMWSGLPQVLIENPHFQFRYIQESRYSIFLSEWESQFGGDVKVILFEEMIQKPRETYGCILDFLGLSPITEISLPHSNPTVDAAGSLGKLAKRIYGLRSVRRLVSGLLGQSWNFKVRWVRDLLYKPVPKISATEYTRCRKMLQGEYDYWERRFPQTRELWNFSNKKLKI